MRRVCVFISVCMAIAMLYGCGASTEPRVERTNILENLIGNSNVAGNNVNSGAQGGSIADSNGGGQESGSSSLTAKDMFEQGIVPQPGQVKETNAGDYMLDVVRTEGEMGGRKLADVFEKYASDGSAMKLADDGAFAFYVGKKGGAGTWQQDGACIKLRVTDYADAHNYEVVLNPFDDNGKTMFCMNYEGVNLYWSR